MFPSLAARETCVAETNFAARKTKMFLSGIKNIFASRTQKLCPKHMFPSLATTGNITRNIVSATLFPSLPRPLQNKRVGVLRMAFRIRKVFDSFEKHTPDHVISKPELMKKIQIKFPFPWEQIGKDRILMSPKNRKHLHILCICFNRISVVSDDVQELEVSRKENEMENSCSDIGEEHRVDGLQGKLAMISYSIYEITLNFRCCLSRVGKIPMQFDRSLIVNPVYHSNEELVFPQMRI